MPTASENMAGLALNTQRYPTNITAVREAIAHAINYTDIAVKVYLAKQGGGLFPMVGPTYPGETQYYDLGNLPPYSFNYTLAKQLLANAGVNPANLPTIEFRVIAGCGLCINTAQIVQGDLGNIGINVNIIVTSPSLYGPPYVAGSGTYATEVSEAQTISQMSWFGTATFAPDEPKPADSWLTWVSNRTSANNWAIYYNPVVQKCVDGFTNGTNQTQLLNICTTAYAQIYNDVPYIWLGNLKLWFGAGSVVWNNQVIKGFIPDPVFSGQSATAIFNTVTFVNGQ